MGEATLGDPGRGDAARGRRPQLDEATNGVDLTAGSTLEDEPAVRRALSRMLESLGQRVLTAADGEEGLALWDVHRDEISAIVTDVRMPHMNGRLMADAVRERAASLPIVFVSGYAADDTLVKSARDYFVPKPLTSTGLVEAFTSLGLEPPRRTPRMVRSV